MDISELERLVGDPRHAGRQSVPPNPCFHRGPFRPTSLQVAEITALR